MGKIKITLVKSTIGRNPNQAATAQILGLTKLNRSVVKDDTEAIRGMIETISHLVKVEEV